MSVRDCSFCFSRRWGSRFPTKSRSTALPAGEELKQELQVLLRMGLLGGGTP